MAHDCGEEPGRGNYKCIHCGQVITLDDNTDKLPPCPKCNKCGWVKN